ncbi:hypothetical protein EA462_16550 [Natrarchaeobius halalkaliphilus]|uniref:Uncharacterized protein n=1 Tax=Natrarchaeobius halalkaliphilus TaxID=1679091 RepID=A0A3N6LHR9_9EURY|nr:hypothetical protein EA462_16550 [Natrarchaeobius halalkaliphilus]
MESKDWSHGVSRGWGLTTIPAKRIYRADRQSFGGSITAADRRDPQPVNRSWQAVGSFGWKMRS